jgi:periplasmic mercuric ion binding protein
MKTNQIFKKVFLLTTFALFITSAISFAGEKTTEITLPTVQCGMCKRIIEKALNKVDGVINSEIDIESKKVSVTYDDTKTDVLKIERAITKAGYDANNRKADKKAYDKLDECCKTK